MKAVVNRCKHPNVTDADGKVLAKRNLSWSIVEDEASLGNSRSLNAILNGVDHNDNITEIIIVQARLTLGLMLLTNEETMTRIVIVSQQELIETLDDESTIESDEEEDGKVLFGCTMEELNMIDVNLSSQQSNIDSIGDSVKQEVFNLSADHIYMK
ncbi:gag-pol polyprotein [Cucumis melo var. makuwa]|uniref:Gag-pol polyprotein n=1 Tax=Cucumis melo var. makuwa TaxID=1194695 RepID=A0A5A7V6E2_CUCMM|nr:gag-pol polyprotein [Cucumis melo var. makuwa]TYJ96732.1 gag-pol polyprotein [Cucumis melo var. makuwa]